MSVDSQHCTLLFSHYEVTKSKVDSYQSYIPGQITNIDTALGSVNDTLLDGVDLSSIDTRNLDTEYTTIKNSLTDAIVECPALVHIYPSSLIAAVDSTLAEFRDLVPVDTNNKFLDRLHSDVEAEITIILNSTVDIAFQLLKSFENKINDLGIPALLNKLEDMEDCLQSGCGLLSVGEKVASTYRTNWRILNSGAINISTFASASSLTSSKLTAAYSQYTSKLDIT